MRRRKGFLLMEALLILCLMAALCSCVFLYRNAKRANDAAGARLTAQFIAQEQFAELSYRGRRERFSAGEIPWLGRAEDLEQGGRYFTVVTEMDGDSPQTATVIVRWEVAGNAQELRLKRRIVYEERRS